MQGKDVRIWRSGEEIAGVLRLIEAGRSDANISSVTGISRHTIRLWRSGRVPSRGVDAFEGRPRCDRCGAPQHGFSTLPPATYAYPLGMYLGDGCLSHGAKDVYYLRITLDSQYPEIVRECREAIRVIRGGAVNVLKCRGKNCVDVTSASKQWPCLLPQHGPGRKHHRKIALEPWQRDIVSVAPESFRRGLIQTDGWRGENRVRVKGRDYSYPRYQFSNRSDDIRRLFTDACELMGVEWRPWGRYHVSVARRDAVAHPDRFVGLKA